MIEKPMSVSLKVLKRRQLEQALLKNKVVTNLKKRTFRRSFLLFNKTNKQSIIDMNINCYESY